MSRLLWTDLTDDQLVLQCATDLYRASGPGGQKRNKTSSAVRLRHQPSGVIVIAEESRSQHENRAKALKRLRVALHLNIREVLPADKLTAGGCADEPAWLAVLTPERRVSVSRREARFWPAAALALDVLTHAEAKLSDAADILSVSTSQLAGFLATDPKLWQATNELRAACGQKPLRT